MHKLLNYVCDELDELEKKVSKENGLSPNDIEYLDKLTHIKKNLLKSELLHDEIENEDYSGDMRGNRMYDRYLDYDGVSYARGRRNAKRDRMGRYSAERGYSREPGDLSDKLRDLMHDAPDDMTRREIERLVEKMEHM